MKRITLSIPELVFYALLAGAAGGAVTDCMPAHAGVTDDAAAVRAAVEHLDKVATKAYVNHFHEQP
jgi:hypothetical protein